MTDKVHITKHGILGSTWSRSYSLRSGPGANVDAFHFEARKATRKQSDHAYIEIAKYFEWDKWEA